MKSALHAVPGALAIALVAIFLGSTLVSELLLGPAAVVAVKTGIVYAMSLLIVSMVATGASGTKLASGRAGSMIDAKRRRMKIIAANGLLLMLPSALFLYFRAIAGAFDTAFYSVQMLELLGGSLQQIGRAHV
jgi:hypothetical protein